MNSLSLRALVALKLLVLVTFWSFGSARTAVSLPPGALARVQPHNSDSGDLFGASVALSRNGQVLVVGADLEASRSGSASGDNSLLRIPLMADSDSISIADSVPGDGGHVAQVS